MVRREVTEVTSRTGNYQGCGMAKPRRRAFVAFVIKRRLPGRHQRGELTEERSPCFRKRRLVETTGLKPAQAASSAHSPVRWNLPHWLHSSRSARRRPNY